MLRASPSARWATRIRSMMHPSMEAVARPEAPTDEQDLGFAILLSLCAVAKPSDRADVLV